MDDIKTTNNQLLTDNQTTRKKIEQLEEQESKRIEKENCHERQILIRDLFLIPLDRLCEELRHNNLSETQVATQVDQSDTGTGRIWSDPTIRQHLIGIRVMESSSDPTVGFRLISDRIRLSESIDISTIEFR
jgi:hypothetical protein